MSKAVIGCSRIHPGSIEIPSSKSLAHRALICAALADNPSVIRNVSLNDDVDRTVDALRHAGCEITVNDSDIKVVPTISIGSYGGSVIDCNASGSTLRFLIPLYSLSGRKCRFTGTARLMERPQDVYLECLDGFAREDYYWCINERIRAGEYSIKGNISSQFITGLLFALPLLAEDSHIHVTDHFESRPYVDMTIDVLKHFGVSVKRNESDIYIPGGQKYKGNDYLVPADDSQGACFLALGVLAGIPVKAMRMRTDSIQGDHAIVDILHKAGGNVTYQNDGYVADGGNLKSFSADISDTPDLGPVLFVLATQCQGTSVITGTERLRLKESDRVEAMRRELSRMGCIIDVEENTVRIKGKQILKDGAELSCHNDHRIAMALSILALAAGKQITLSEAECIKKSYPDFFEDLKQLGADIKIT